MKLERLQEAGEAMREDLFYFYDPRKEMNAEVTGQQQSERRINVSEVHPSLLSSDHFRILLASL